MLIFHVLLPPLNHAQIRQLFSFWLCCFVALAALILLSIISAYFGVNVKKPAIAGFCRPTIKFDTTASYESMSYQNRRSLIIEI